MELITQNWSGISSVVAGILISDIIGMSRLKANSVIELTGQIIKGLWRIISLIRSLKKK